MAFFHTQRISHTTGIEEIIIYMLENVWEAWKSISNYFLLTDNYFIYPKFEYYIFLLYNSTSYPHHISDKTVLLFSHILMFFFYYECGKLQYFVYMIIMIYDQEQLNFIFYRNLDSRLCLNNTELAFHMFETASRNTNMLACKFNSKMKVYNPELLF